MTADIYVSNSREIIPPTADTKDELLTENKKDLLQLPGELDAKIILDNIEHELRMSDLKESLTIERIDDKQIKIKNKNGAESVFEIKYLDGFYDKLICRLSYFKGTSSLYIKNRKISDKNNIYKSILEYVFKIQNTAYTCQKDLSHLASGSILVPGSEKKEDEDENFYIVYLIAKLDGKKLD